MRKSGNCRDFIASKNAPEQIIVSGFEVADNCIHMLEWIRRGKNFRQFVVADIEAELYAQDANSQLLSVHCKEVPNFETHVRTEQNVEKGLLTKFVATFPVSLRVRSDNGKIWRLEVEHSYLAANLDLPDQFQLKLDFTIVGHEIEA